MSIPLAVGLQCVERDRPLSFRNSFHDLDVGHHEIEMDFMIEILGIMRSKSVSRFGYRASSIRNAAS
jgi:hypothetical protein